MTGRYPKKSKRLPKNQEDQPFSTKKTSNSIFEFVTCNQRPLPRKPYEINPPCWQRNFLIVNGLFEGICGCFGQNRTVYSVIKKIRQVRREKFCRTHLFPGRKDSTHHRERKDSMKETKHKPKRWHSTVSSVPLHIGLFQLVLLTILSSTIAASLRRYSS